MWFILLYQVLQVLVTYDALQLVLDKSAGTPSGLAFLIEHPHFFSLKSVLSLTSITFSIFWNFNCLIMRFLSLLFSVIDWRNVYKIHHAIPHDLGLSITFFSWSLCRSNWIYLRVKQNSLPMGRKQDWDVSVRFTEWNEVFLRLKQTVSVPESMYFL